MSSRDQRCHTGACRDAVLELLFGGRFPSERHVEMLLDRLEREERPILGDRQGLR